MPNNSSNNSNYVYVRRGNEYVRDRSLYVRNGNLYSNGYLCHGDFKYTAKKWINGQWRYFYDGAEKAYGKAKSGVTNFVDTKITGKSAKKNMNKASNKQTAATKAFKTGYSTLQDIRSYNQDQYMSDRKNVTKLNQNVTKQRKLNPTLADSARAISDEAASDMRVANRQRNRDLKKQAKSLVSDPVRQYQEATKEYNAAKKSYDSSVRGWAEKTYNDVVSSASKSISSGKKKVEKTLDKASDWAKKTYNDIVDTASDAIDKAKDWLGSIFGKKKKK